MLRVRSGRTACPLRARSDGEPRGFTVTHGPTRTNNPVEEAQLIRKVPPSYPPLAKQARVEGVVRLAATIGTDGKLHNIRVLSGHPLLSGAAVAAVQQWRYTPTRLNGNPVEAETQIDVNFTRGQ